MPGLFNYNNPSAEVFEDAEPILSDLQDGEWTDLLKHMERRRFPSGAHIMRSGECDRSLYLLAEGTVDIIIDTSGRPKRIASISEGSVFGEMAFFDGQPRSASVVASSEVEVLSLTLDRFEQLAAWHPRIACRLLMDLGRVLSRRLRYVQR